MRTRIPPILAQEVRPVDDESPRRSRALGAIRVFLVGTLCLRSHARLPRAKQVHLFSYPHLSMPTLVARWRALESLRDHRLNQHREDRPGRERGGRSLSLGRYALEDRVAGQRG